MILLTFDITTVCLTSRSKRARSGGGWDGVPAHLGSSSPPMCHQSSLAPHVPSPSTGPGLPPPHPHSPHLPWWVRQPFCWGWPWHMVGPSFCCWTGESGTWRPRDRLTFCHLDDNHPHRWASRCFGGLPLPMLPLRQAAAQLGCLAVGTSCTGPICPFGCNTYLPAGVTGTFSTNQVHCQRWDFVLDGGGLGRHALLLLFLNPLVAH